MRLSGRGARWHRRPSGDFVAAPDLPELASRSRQSRGVHTRTASAVSRSHRSGHRARFCLGRSTLGRSHRIGSRRFVRDHDPGTQLLHPLNDNQVIWFDALLDLQVPITRDTGGHVAGHRDAGGDCALRGSPLAVVFLRFSNAL